MRRHPRVLALSFVALFVSAIDGYAAAGDAAPPPGLYRVDIDSNTDLGKGTVKTRFHLDGATGTMAGTSVLAGAGSHQEHVKGRGPHTECIRPGSAPLHFLGFARTCTDQATRPTANGAVHTASCPAGKTKMTVTRLGKDVWELVSETEQALGAGPADLSFMRPILEREARYAARDEDRKKAAKALADLAYLDKETAAKRAATVNMLSVSGRKDGNRPGTGASGPSVAQLLASRTMHVRVRKVLTRIAGTCEGTR